MLSSFDCTIRTQGLPGVTVDSEGGGNVSNVVPKAQASWTKKFLDASDKYQHAQTQSSSAHWQERLNALRPALVTAHEEIERLYASLRPLGYWAVMADTAGVIVYRRCQPSEEPSLDSLGVRAGAPWPEAVAEHNGLDAGHGRPETLCIQREHHSSGSHHSLNSVGVRICNSRGRYLGSLGAFARSTETTDAVLSLVVSIVADWARAIEERLFRDAYSDAWILCVDLREGEAPGLLAIDSEQSLLAANAVARRSLGFTDQAIGKKLETLGVRGMPVPRQAANQRDDVHLHLQLQDRRGTATALISAPIVGWSTTELRQFRTRPRVLWPGRSHHPELQPPLRSGGLSPHVLSAIQSYIGSHLAETLSVSALARKAGLSRNYFLSAFSASTGVTPHRYIVRQRNAKAAEMLSNTDMELADIALTVGFADQSHFTRSFSRLMDCTPSAFRRSCR